MKVQCLILALGFLLGIQNGSVTVWKNEDPEPWKIAECPARFFPEEDRKRLLKGLFLPDESSLAQALEDYGF